MINPAILNPEAKVVSKTLEQFINQYLDEISDEFADTKTLKALKNICGMILQDAYTLSRQDFSSFAIERRKGNPIEK